MAKFKDDNITTKNSDIEKVQAKPTVYISYTGKAGSLHLAKEIINNIIDESQNENSPCNQGTIYYDETIDTLYSEDNGRGIPFESLEVACTLLHAGSKEKRDQDGGSSAGENGIGITAVNALSERFEIISYRYGEAMSIKFIDGILTSKKVIKIPDKNKHGLQIIFKPSRMFLGSDACIPIQELEDWLTKVSFIMPNTITLKFETSMIGKEASVHKTFKNKTGLPGYLPKIAPQCDLFKNSIVLANRMSIMEDDIPVRDEDGTIKKISLERFIELQVAINYNTNSSECNKDSFCNCIHNVEDGEHMRGSLAAFVTYMRKQVRATFTKKEQEYTVGENDILSGLYIVVNLNTTMSTKFASQTKEKLGNPAFFEPLKNLMDTALVEYFRASENKKTLAKLVDYIKTNIRMRLAANKVRTKIKQSSSFIDDKDIKGYIPPNNIRIKGAYRELYIVEGDSAGGNSRTGRFDNNTQGVFKLKGKPKNVYKLGLDKVLDTDEYENLFTALGCGVGPSFKMEDLLYSKIIICTDADVDGHHIAGLLASTFLKYVRSIVEAGILYRLITPLYRLAENASKKKQKASDKFLFTKNEFFALYELNVSNKIRLKFDIDGDFISKDMMRGFLAVNRDYYQVLDTVRGHYSVESDVVEFMAAHRDFRDCIKELDDELEYSKSDDKITGVYRGIFTHIILEDIFIQQLKYLTDIIEIGNKGRLFYHVYEKYSHTNEVYKGNMSIGQIMTMCQKFEPDIKTRFKGLGELRAEELLEIGMNPNNRTLVRLTVEDIEEAYNEFDRLFMTNNADDRKVLINESQISPDDIDN